MVPQRNIISLIDFGECSLAHTSPENCSNIESNERHLSNICWALLLPPWRDPTCSLTEIGGHVKSCRDAAIVLLRVRVERVPCLRGTFRSVCVCKCEGGQTSRGRGEAASSCMTGRSLLLLLLLHDRDWAEFWLSAWTRNCFPGSSSKELT